MSEDRHEEGAALLTVLLLVAVLSVLAMVALDRLTLATRLAGNVSAMEQARSYARASELIAASRIASFRASTASQNTAANEWLGREMPFPIDGGTATATLRDGANCFNLNSVAYASAQGVLSARPEGIAQFEALMVSIGIARPLARRIATASADWVDTDTAPLPGGAEDESYRGYRTGNTLFADASELRAVAGVPPGTFVTLKPWICALPAADLSPINVNTLRERQFPLLMMMMPGRLTESEVRRMIRKRPANGYASTVDFWRIPALRGITPAAEVLGQPKVQTSWFGLDIRVELGGINLEQASLIDARSEPVKVVRRHYGGNS